MFQNCVPHPVLTNVMVCDEVPVVRPLEFDFGVHYVELPRAQAKPLNTVEGLGADLIGPLL